MGLELPGKLADAVAERGGGRGAIFVSGGLGTLVERHERMRHGARMAGAQALPRQAAVEAIAGSGMGYPCQGTRRERTLPKQLTARSCADTTETPPEEPIMAHPSVTPAPRSA